VFAPAATAATLTLAQAQQEAIAHNADVRTAAAQAEAAIAQVRAAREFPNPTLGLSTAKIATDGSGNGTPAGNRFQDRSYDSIVALSQLVELGKRGPRRESAEAAQRAAEAQRDDVRRLTLAAVSQAYVAALEAREESRVLAASAASLRREAKLAQVRLAAGDLAANDQAQIALAAGRLDLDAAAARHAATTAVIVLETLLGEAAPAGATELADSLEALPLPPAALAGEAPAGTRPDVAAAEAAVAKAGADLTLQKRAPVPDLTLSVQYERNPPDQPNTAGVGLSFPLPLWNRNGGNIRAARAAQDVAQAQLDKARLQAAAEVAASRSAFREARERAAAYREKLRPQSASVTQTVAYAYEHGGASLLELLAAERNDNDVRLAAARASADAAAASFALAAALNRSAP
jgi:cobalt-zinc-cadmium efflux system outer membrane protein